MCQRGKESLAAFLPTFLRRQIDVLSFLSGEKPERLKSVFIYRGSNLCVTNNPPRTLIAGGEKKKKRASTC